MTSEGVLSYHASDGQAYERFLGRWSRRLAAAFIGFVRPPPEGDVVDIGCGTGSLTFALAAGRARRRILGIDKAAPYVAFARALDAGGEAAFLVADACRIPCPSGAFSAAVAQLVLNFVPDAMAAALEMRRVTQPGGVIAACVWDFRGGLVYQRILWDTAAGIDPAAADVRDRLFSHPLAQPDGLAALWRAAGIVQVEATSLTIRMDYASFADYWEPMLGGQGPVGTYVRSLDADRAGRVSQSVRAAYLAGGPDGRRSMTASAWAVRGTAP